MVDQSHNMDEAMKAGSRINTCLKKRISFSFFVQLLYLFLLVPFYGLEIDTLMVAADSKFVLLNDSVDDISR